METNLNKTWSVEVFNEMMEWAKTNYPPNNSNKTYWELYYNANNDSTELLHEIKKIMLENKTK